MKRARSAVATSAVAASGFLFGKDGPEWLSRKNAD
jgi:hypothetical protein